MKKKLFLALVVSILFVCLFAIGVSAADFASDYTTDITEIGTGPGWADLTDTNATAVIKKADGTAVRIPAYYIVKTGTTFYTNGTNMDFGWITTKLGEEITTANLVALDIPSDFTSISGAFNGTNLPALEELVIPTSITSLGQSMFRNNNVLRKVFVKQTRDAEGNVQGVTTLPGWFADITNGSVSALEEFNFELDYLTSIGGNAFMNSAIKSFRIEAPITSIGGTVFCGCQSLETVYINNTGDIITIGSKVFAGCTNIKSVTLNGLSLSDYLFENANGAAGTLEFVATNVATTGTMPFKNATNLKSAIISGPIESVGNSLFLGCSSLETVSITNTLATSATGGKNMCDGLKNLKSVSLHGISIGDYAFRQIAGTDMALKFTNVGLIGTQAFYKAENITELYISGPFTSVGNSTYRECPKLTKLTVINTGDTLVSAGNGESNPVLEELRLEGKFEIGSPTFQNNTALKHIYLGTGVQSVGRMAFFKCYALETAYLADTIQTIADSAFDMDAAGKQTSEIFMLVDENGNMDNTLPTSLTSTGGHFLKGFTFANTRFVYPSGYTSAANSAYDFENAVYPEGFNIVYLGKMTIINHHILYKHNNSKDITIYLTQNKASDLKGERINVNIAEDGSMSHGSYAGSTTGTLEIVIDDNLQNNIKPAEYVKFYFCGSDEIVFVTRVNIPREEGGASSWGNFVSMPVTYAQLTAAGVTIDKHPIIMDPKYYAPTCEDIGGVKTFCVCGTLVKLENEEPALGHMYDAEKLIDKYYPLVNGVANYFADAIHIYLCPQCNENVEETFENTSLFTNYGYSANEEDYKQISYTVYANEKLITEFSSYKDVTIKYGLVISALPDGAPLAYENGTIVADEATVKAEMQGTKYNKLSVMVYNLPQNQELHCNGYVVVDGTISYLNHNTVDAEATNVTHTKIIDLIEASK